MADDMKFLGFRMPLPLARKMEEVVRSEGMQITEYVRGLVREDLRKRGMLEPERAAEAQSSTAEVGA